MTMEEIAKQLGLSKSTVSRALSGKGRVGADTREKILACVHSAEKSELQLAPSGVPRTHCLGVVIPMDAYMVSIPFFQECLLGISESATMLKYNVLILTGVANDISGIQSLIENHTVDGIILMRSVEEDRVLKYLTDIHFPTGLCGQCEYDEVIQVDSDNRQAAENLTSILIERGYRRFSMVAGNISYKVNAERCAGFFHALERRDLPRSEQLYYPNFVNMELIDSIISDILRKKVECIVCADDVICTRLMSRLQAERYRIPRDISIVSLYNSTNLECFSPAVTAVNISAKRVGNMIGKQMISRLEGNDYSPKTMLDYEILFRQSAGKEYR